MQPMPLIAKLALILRRTANPLPLILDHLNLKTGPYCVGLGTDAVVELRPRSGDRFGFFEVGVRQDYFNAGQLLRPGDTVVDVGANIGCFTIMASRRVGPGGMVIAVEPEASAYAQLSRNLALNRISNVRTFNVALGGTTGVVELHTSAASGLFSSIYQRVNNQSVSTDVQVVPMMTLDALFEQALVKRCHYLKLDCEGAEHDIIGRLSVSDASRIDQITLEVHGIEGRNRSDIETKLRHHGFELVSRRICEYYSRLVVRERAAGA